MTSRPFGAIIALAFATAASARAATDVLPMPVEQVQERLATAPASIQSAKAAGAGVMGARKLRLVFKDGATLDVKWKATPSDLDGWNNTPRREIAAYEVQRLFLGPEEWLVPPTVVRCVPLETYRIVVPEPTPNVAGFQCVFGALSAWLDNVEPVDEVFDRERFARDPRYAKHFANLNLLDYLIEHRDARTSNFLIAKDPADGREFSIDNGISFGEPIYNFLSANFDTIRVSALPRESVERLRRLSRADLDRLAVLGQFDADAAGVLRPVTPTANIDPDSGTRFTEQGIQIGLTRAEIDAIEKRLQDLLRRIDAGDVPLF
jgi:hypothetical protein